MFGINGSEWWILLVIVLLIFGPSKLPDLARSMGKSVTEFRKGMKDVHDEVKEGKPEESPKPEESESLKRV
jgi:sec-independent protein translocase protein TatA